MSLLNYLNTRAIEAFKANDIPEELAVFTASDRPDLADFQCNGAFQAAKALRKNPREIASSVQKHLANDPAFEEVSVAGPGFINVRLTNQFISENLAKLDFENVIGEGEEPETMIFDYGGPNIAKPLHVGHLRSAVIGDSVKRIARSLGHKVIADIHLGDWGTPMGMLIAELEERHPDWPYFSKTEESFPEESPINVDDLNKLYPEAATHFKEDKNFADKARVTTAELQAGRAGYRALWQHFVNTSLSSVKKDFAALDVNFDLWLGESHADVAMPEMIADLKQKGLAVESDGATVIHVAREDDDSEFPPLILEKTGGGVTYGATDLATIYQRANQHKDGQEKIDRIVYIVDQRQSLHFKQVFRAAALAGYIDEDHLEHLGFGTVNGPDGKPFKTREGGVMRLSDLLQMARDEVAKKMGIAGKDDQDLTNMAEAIAMAAVKYGDLSSQRLADYIFDTSAFVKLEGKTGPYIQYAAVRVQSLIDKAAENDLKPGSKITLEAPEERALALLLLEYPIALQRAHTRRMPSDLCEHVYNIAQAYSRFYQNCPVMTADSKEQSESRLALSQLCRQDIVASMDKLGIEIPERMVTFGQDE
ncbi:MAG: arginine--tRNA ligase [Gammaproteobacteria bacterium]